MYNTQRHKHADLIIAWANGAKIEYKSTFVRNWTYIKSPSWLEDSEYRIKPKALVKKWRWVFQSRDQYAHLLQVTSQHFEDQDEFNAAGFTSLTLIEKVDSTMIEVEE